MTDREEKELFDALCAAESYRSEMYAPDSIGIYMEKRLHRILKHTLCQNESCHEVKVGGFIADIKEGGQITEVQSKNFAALKKKLEYYLESTDCNICIVHPVIVKKTIVRAERESGEVLYVRRSPKKHNIYKTLASLYPIAELLTSPRIGVRLMLIEAEEYRYSERVRYRKTGAYDSELFPTSLVDTVDLYSPADYSSLMPEGIGEGEHTAKDFETLFKLRGRDVYSALNVLSSQGVICRKKDGNRVKYIV